MRKIQNAYEVALLPDGDIESAYPAQRVTLWYDPDKAPDDPRAEAALREAIKRAERIERRTFQTAEDRTFGGVVKFLGTVEKEIEVDEHGKPVRRGAR